VLFRPVLCAVPPYDKFITSPQPAVSAASCGPSTLTPASMQVSPSKQSATGFIFQSPQPAILLEGERTTKAAHDAASKVVLLSGLPGSSVYAATSTSKGTRYVLGPAVMTSRSIASATATKLRDGQWVVDWTTTAAGTSVWDRVARTSFHRLLAMDVGGVVVSAPIIEPTQVTFTSFKGRGEVTGNWGEAEAQRIAAAMSGG
jgi:preprotein translocase subunit SecD